MFGLGPMTFLVVLVLGGFLVAGVMLLKRASAEGDEAGSRACPSCQAKNPQGARFCANCGQSFDS